MTVMRFNFGQYDMGPSSPGMPFSTYFSANGSINSGRTNVTADIVDPVTGVVMQMPRMPVYTHDRGNHSSYPYSLLGD